MIMIVVTRFLRVERRKQFNYETDFCKAYNPTCYFVLFLEISKAKLEAKFPGVKLDIIF